MKERLRKMDTSQSKYSKNDLNKSFNKYAKKQNKKKTKPYNFFLNSYLELNCL